MYSTLRLGSITRPISYTGTQLLSNNRNPFYRTVPELNNPSRYTRSCLAFNQNTKFYTSYNRTLVLDRNLNCKTVGSRLSAGFPGSSTTRFYSSSANSSTMKKLNSSENGESTEELAARLRKTFFTGKTRSYEWRMEQLRGIERFIYENEKLFTDSNEASIDY